MTRLDAIFHDEQHARFINTIPIFRVRRYMRANRGLIDANRTCSYCKDQAGPPDFTPTGPECGARATHFILWDDGRWSLGCEEHLGPFEDPAPPCVIIPLDT